ncbi:hypothetical protein ACFXPT_11810 [Streptomyces goshikiensis]|uniref:hypothetical protein n=1 Tax=Streptomyces goshikiensis TaxID=1942 RepID=UPI0036BCFAF6
MCTNANVDEYVAVNGLLDVLYSRADQLLGEFEGDLLGAADSGECVTFARAFSNHMTALIRLGFYSDAENADPEMRLLYLDTVRQVMAADSLLAPAAP